MSYSNTHHPSNTRTTVTIVLSIIFGVSIIPTTALGTSEVPTTPLYFTLENADVLTLYQEVKVKIERGSAVTGDAKEFKQTDTFDAGDKIYFIKTDTAAKCAASPTNGITPRQVTVPDSKAYAEATVIIKAPEFLVDQSYKMCYKKTSSGTSTVYDAVYKPRDGTAPTAFTIQSSMFTACTMTPTTVYAGQGPIELSITVTDPKVDSRVFPSGAESQRAYLIPCTTEQCSKKDDIVLACSSKADAISTDVVTVLTTDTTTTFKTTFTAPAAKVSTSYMVCVPYCFKAGKCASEEISWALVNSQPIQIAAAKPVSYTLEPSSPQARTLTKITFTGTGLANGDKIRIIPQGQQCSSSTARDFLKIEYTAVTATSPADSTKSEFKFRLKGELKAPAVATVAVTLQVCYAHAANPNVWAPVYKTAAGTAADLTISPLQPTGFSIVSPSPEIGQLLKIYFTGTGLGVGDSSYLVECTPEASSLQTTDYCDDKYDTTAPKYRCNAFTQDGRKINCNVLINPAVSSSGGMKLCACYKKHTHPNYALVDGSVTVPPKTIAEVGPTYTITSYPFYVGQGAKLKFTGTGLSAADKVKIIAQDGDCNTDGNALVGVSITAKNGEQYTYTITGSKSVCFTVCYRRGTTWTLSTNTGTSVGTTTCTSASSSFITDTRLRYTLSPQEPSKQQTVTVTFKDDSSYLVGSLIIIPIKEECATSLCEGLAPCDHPPQSGDTYEVKTPTSGIFMATLKGSYVICTRATSASELPWIPIRNANPTGNRHYTFDVGDKVDASADKSSKTTVAKGPPKVSVTVPPMPDGNNSTTLSATATSSTIPAVLITSVVFMYLYNW